VAIRVSLFPRERDEDDDEDAKERRDDVGSVVIKNY